MGASRLMPSEKHAHTSKQSFMIVKTSSFSRNLLLIEQATFIIAHYFRKVNLFCQKWVYICIKKYYNEENLAKEALRRNEKACTTGEESAELKKSRRHT
jgi:hypothetical protein